MTNKELEAKAKRMFGKRYEVNLKEVGRLKGIISKGGNFEGYIYATEISLVDRKPHTNGEVACVSASEVVPNQVAIKDIPKNFLKSINVKPADYPQIKKDTSALWDLVSMYAETPFNARQRPSYDDYMTVGSTRNWYKKTFITHQFWHTLEQKNVAN